MRIIERIVMLKNRQLTVKLDKPNKVQTTETSCDPKAFERKVETVLHNLESIGAKMFLGVCIYVMLDTRRQVAVARAIYHP